MTEKEIVQALRQCAKSDCSSCEMCPIFPDRECVERLATAAASLIERLTAENAALKKEIRKAGCMFCARFEDCPEGFKPTGQEDFAMIDAADVCAFLPDWEESRGARLERAYCEYIGKRAETWND